MLEEGKEAVGEEAKTLKKRNLKLYCGIPASNYFTKKFMFMSETY